MKNEKPYLTIRKIVIDKVYNPAYGDNRTCECGHPYYRHFDGYDNNAAIGCKYCECRTFVEKKTKRIKNGKVIWKDINAFHEVYPKKYWYGRKNGFTFNITYDSRRLSNNNDKIRISIQKKKPDIRFISDWPENNINFKNVDEAKEFCEKFKPENYHCLGNGVEKGG